VNVFCLDAGGAYSFLSLRSKPLLDSHYQNAAFCLGTCGSARKPASPPLSILCRFAPDRFQLVSLPADRRHRQECLCHISLMPLGKPTIISQAERICAQKVPLPYSGAEESAPSLTGLGMTMRVWVRIDSLARNFNSRRRFNAAPPPMSERFAPARRQNARNRRKNRVVPAGDKTGGIPGPEKRIQESR